MIIMKGTQMPLPYSEDRDDTRFDHISHLQVKDLSSGEVYEAKMLNYSNGGIYFESDGVFQEGTKIYICMQRSPYVQSSRVMEYFTGEIMWRKCLNRSFFDYGYGFQLVSDSCKQGLDSKDVRKGKDSRKHPRKSLFRNIRFGTDRGIFEGSTKNISASGVFIATDKKLEVGQSIRLNLSVKKGKTAKITGQIVWVNEKGFGLKFKKIK
jgi:Tfp pilus assembly protein PilZ